MTDAIQLSKLPPPDVVESLDFEAIYAIAKAKFKELKPDFNIDLESSTPAKVLQVVAYMAMNLRQHVNDASRANMLGQAKKGDLDNLCALLGVKRLVITPADPEHGIPDPVMEEDDDLRERATLAPASFSVAGPEAAYEFHARSASGDVLDASATSPQPGYVVVSVLSRTGDGTASVALLNTVNAAVSAENVRPLTDFTTTQSAEIVPFAVAARLWSFAGPDPAVALAAAEANLDAYLAASRRLGRDITLSALYAALQVPGIQNVIIDSPAATIVVSDTQAAYCTGKQLTYEGIGE
ncbi:phage-related baseplate assembly protein [Luteibacter sp. 1214]|uniref:baseplate assembly protein n=1 Tax=Luteibacter sp. 1214 TaxID=2817735 RepID=UPI002866D80C|nr:baseplate J/gp47 family protein [Luteibacter sp. 1214]MDR6642769.1 phage-related baseplate assembly protein [Luteibacter sp. 1214]